MSDTAIAPPNDESEQYPSPVRGKDGAIPTPASLDREASELWNMAFEDALQVTCQSAIDPRKCAIQVAWKAVKEKYGGESENFVARDTKASNEKSMASKEETAMVEDKLVLAARGVGIDPVALQKRRAVRAKEEDEDKALLDAGYSLHPARRPDGVSSVEWSALPLEEKTVGAVVWRRHCIRNYAEAVENAVLEGWKAEKNPHRKTEWIFKSWVDTPDGWQLVRGILVRRADKSDWYMREVSRGASLSLAIRVAPDEVRR